MASWKKILTEGDDGSLSAEDQTISEGRTITFNNSNADGPIDFKLGVGSAGTEKFMTATSYSGLAVQLVFDADGTIFNGTMVINSIVQTSGENSGKDGGIRIRQNTDDGGGFCMLHPPHVPAGFTSFAIRMPHLSGGDDMVGKQLVISDYNLTQAESSSGNVYQLEAQLQPGALDNGNMAAPGDYQGETFAFSGFANTAFERGTAYIFKGTAAPTKSDADAVADAGGMLVMATTTVGATPSYTFLKKGLIMIPKANIQGTVPTANGAILYLHPSGGDSADEGKLTTTIPDGSGEVVRHVGYVVDIVDVSGTDYASVMFEPSTDFITLA